MTNPYNTEAHLAETNPYNTEAHLADNTTVTPDNKAELNPTTPETPATPADAAPKPRPRTQRRPRARAHARTNAGRGHHMHIEKNPNGTISRVLIDGAEVPYKLADMLAISVDVKDGKTTATLPIIIESVNMRPRAKKVD